jgi:CBS domain containing-hemolysin-like protein
VIVGLVLFLVGLLLSGLFSGSETGFYRATRVRLLLDGLAGDSISRALLWLTNNPALFVATTLIGNNLANYIVSFAIVLVAQSMFGGTHLAELIAPVLLTPVIFVYGELLPKSLFYDAPNYLLRRTGPVFLLFTIVFAPVSAVLWALGWILQRLIGEAPLRVQLTLARQELQQVLEEGQEAGILRPAQRHLAQSLFSVASRRIGDFAAPVARVAAVRLGDSKAEVLRLARRHGSAVLPVAENNGRELVGYVRVIDLYLDDASTLETVRPMLVLPERDSHIAALIRLQSEGEELARVVDQQGETVGLLFADELTAPLFRGA